MEQASGSNLAMMVVLLAILGLVPFILTMITSFAKLVVVGGLIRQALGTPQIPPTAVLTGLALILTVHIMSPLAVTMYDAYQQATTETQEAQEAQETQDPQETEGEDRGEGREGREEGEDAQVPVEVEDIIARVANATFPPMEDFLQRHSDPQNVALFRSLRSELQGPDEETRRDWPVTSAQVDTITILAPAFVLTELTEAFQIGFLIFIPFLILDLVVSNILLAMGMHMLSPVTISLPLKLLLFVLIDGWRLILQGVVLGYT